MENLRKYRKINKLCVQCGKPLDREGSYCIRCNLKSNELKRKYSKENIEHGKCSTCGTLLDRKGLFCTVCTEKLRKRENIRSAERRANHQCVQCGEENIEGSYCQRCRAMRSERYYSTKSKKKKY